MKKYMVVWGLVLIAVGYLLFRYVTFHVYPESIVYAQTGHLKQFWDGLTVWEKLFLTATELPMYGGIVLVVVGLARLAKRKQAV